MAFIRSKQIKLSAAGDLLIGGTNGAGEVLAKGTTGQVLKATAGSIEYASIVASEVTRGESNVGADLTALEGRVTTTENDISENETLISAIITSAGLDTDGTLEAFTGANYIDESTTLREALVDLDTSLKTVEDNAMTDTFANTGAGPRTLSSTTIVDAINEVMATATVSNVTSSAPTASDDETAGYKAGDLWVFGSQIYVAESVTEDAAVWTRIDNGASTDIFRFKGVLDATTNTLPSTPTTGDTYRIGTAGDFGGVGPTVAVGDYIVWNGTSWDKLDNTDPAVSGTTNRISVTGNADVGYTIDVDSNYVGQASITTLGTITTGTWNGTTIATANGGTGLTTVGAEGTYLRVGAEGVLEYAEIDLDITELKDSDGEVVASSATGTLTAVTGTDAGDADLAYTTKGYVDGLVENVAHIRQEDDETVVTPAVNYSFDLTATPIGLASVYFNGLKLLKSGYTITGTTVALVDSVNGYTVDAGDVISVSYDRSPIA